MRAQRSKEESAVPNKVDSIALPDPRTPFKLLSLSQSSFSTFGNVPRGTFLQACHSPAARHAFAVDGPLHEE
jgi:hypothetical protein